MDAQDSDREISVHADGERGATGWALLWLIGVPVPILIALFLLRGCT